VNRAPQGALKVRPTRGRTQLEQQIGQGDVGADALDEASEGVAPGAAAALAFEPDRRRGIVAKGERTGARSLCKTMADC